MSTKEFLIQNQFLNFLRTDLNIDVSESAQNELLESLTASTNHRLQAYRVSYFSRFCDVLTECIYYPLLYLLPKGYLKSLLYEFYKIEIPTEDIILSSAKFPEFLKNHEMSDNYPFAYDLAMLCLQYYHLLHKKDPEKHLDNFLENIDPTQIYLQKNYIYYKSQYPILDLWNLSLEIQTTIAQAAIDQKNIPMKEQAFLTVKSSPYEIESLEIEKQYDNFILTLGNGENLDAAIEQLSTRKEHLQPEKFSLFIAQMTRKKMFRLNY